MTVSEVVEFAHNLILESKHKKVAVDATLGNGHDSLLLAKNFEKVYGFDIQQLAIRRSKRLLSNYQNVSVYLASNTLIDKYVKDEIDLVIFNLGFLPGSDRKVKTNANDTVSAIAKILPQLSNDGEIIIVCYLRHDNGTEFNQIVEYLNLNKFNHLIYDQFKFDKVVVVKK